MTVRLTCSQALIRFLSVQYSERDGRRQPFFAGVFGIFGHGNVAGIGQALHQMRDRVRYYQCRNEQAMVHTAAAFAKRTNQAAREADLVIAIGTRLADFTTMSKTAFADPGVRFIGINVCAFDAFKHSALPVVADARAAIEELTPLLEDFHTSTSYRDAVNARSAAWRAEVERLFAQPGDAPFPQAVVVGAVNTSAAAGDVVVAAAGSVPGDLHKLWRSRQPNTYHLEYGYSCMGYEIAGGLGVKMADPANDVYVMVGDGSFLMMAQEIVTSIQEGCKLIVVLLDSQGYASIGGLSRSVGSEAFGTQYRYRNAATGALDGGLLPVDLATNAESLGAIVHRVTTRASLTEGTF